MDKDFRQFVTQWVARQFGLDGSRDTIVSAMCAVIETDEEFWANQSLWSVYDEASVRFHRG